MATIIHVGGGGAAASADTLCFTANTAGSTIAMSVTGTPTLGQNFQYSTDGNTWNTFTHGTTTVTLAAVGDKVYFKGNNPNGVSESSSIYYKFVMTGSIAASGDVMSLIDNGACSTTEIPNSYCFCRLFRGCTSLTTAPALPATTLASSCYQAMFGGCTALTIAPTLPAITLAEYCYRFMFEDCTALTTAPELPATTLAGGCYREMFNSCTALKVYTAAATGRTAWRIPMSGTGTAGTDSLTDMLTNTGGDNIGTPEINTTYYIG